MKRVAARWENLRKCDLERQEVWGMVLSSELVPVETLVAPMTSSVYRDEKMKIVLNVIWSIFDER